MCGRDGTRVSGTAAGTSTDEATCCKYYVLVHDFVAQNIGGLGKPAGHFMPEGQESVCFAVLVLIQVANGCGSRVS